VNRQGDDEGELRKDLYSMLAPNLTLGEDLMDDRPHSGAKIDEEGMCTVDGGIEDVMW
jgi:hypothetical protein